MIECSGKESEVRKAESLKILKYFFACQKCMESMSLIVKFSSLSVPGTNGSTISASDCQEEMLHLTRNNGE